MGMFQTGDFTQSVEDIKGINEALHEKAFSKPAITDFHSFVEGIVVKKKLVILGRLEGLLGKGSGECDPTSSENSFGGVEKFWDLAPISDRLEQCYTDLEDKFTAWGLKAGIQKPDLTNTDFADYVVEIVSDALYECVLRNAWFGDVDADDIAGGGVLTNGTDPAYFNKLDGFWKQIFAIIGANSDQQTLGFDTKNAQATFALQKFNATDVTNKVAITTLDKLTTDCDERLSELSDTVIVVTKSVFDQYKRELKFSNISFTTERIEKGIEKLEIDGLTIVKFSFWDRIIKAYYSDGTKWYLPHRAVLLSKSNMMVGVETVGELSEVDVFFDKTKKKNFVDFLFKLDVKIGFDHEIQAAY